MFLWQMRVYLKKLAVIIGKVMYELLSFGCKVKILFQIG